MIVLDFQDFIHQYINRVNIEIYGLIKKEISLKIEEENFFSVVVLSLRSIV